MLAKRIVPCLDIKDGKTVKGINFVNFRDAGDPVELGAQYSREGADEIDSLNGFSIFYVQTGYYSLGKHI